MFSLTHFRQPGASGGRTYSFALLRILAIAALLSALVSSAATSRFSPIPSFPSGGSAFYAVTADVNGDGKPDVITSNTNGKVTVLLGDGKGGFLAPKVIATIPGVPAPSIAVGDFNRDGMPDLAVVWTSANIVKVFLGHGDGTFASPITVSTSAGPTQVAIADVNNDDREDLLVGCTGGFNVILGNGNGTFGKATKVASPNGTDVVLLAVGDVNKDGHLDVISANDQGPGSVFTGVNYEFLGNGNGTFQPGNSNVDTSLPQLTGQSQLLLVDLNGDGKLDLVIMGVQTCDTCRQQVLVGFGDGTGNFQFTGFNAGAQPASVAAMDLNGDGKPDLAVANFYSNSVSVLLNKGGGQFAPPVNYATRLLDLPPFGWAPLTSGDFNGDKRPDLALATTDGVQALINLGGGRLSAPPSVETLGVVVSAAAVDLNGDGHVDLAVESAPVLTNQSLENALALFGNGTGQFTPVLADVENPVEQPPIAVGDFNRDGKLDLAELFNGELGNFVDMELNSGHNTFPVRTTPINLNTASASATVMAAGDFNNDGYADVALILANGEVDIYLNNRNGTFSGPTAYTVGTNPNFILVFDLNRDGKRDLIVTNNGSDDVSVLYGKGDGTFASAMTLPSGTTHLSSITVGDFNRDGQLDLAVGGDTVEILLGRGNNQFASPVSYPSGGPVAFVQQASLRGNNIQDLLMVHGGTTNNLTVLFGKGDGTFAAPTSYLVGARPVGLTVGDFNGDGAPDVALRNFGFNGSTALTLLWNQGGTRTTLKNSTASAKVGQPITFTSTVQASIAGAGTPIGNVTFKDGSKSIAIIHLTNGKAVFTTSQLSQGTHTITANYGGDGNFNPHVSAPVKETIGP